MPAKHYYPKREGNQRAFFSNLQIKIATYYTLLDISPARQSKIVLTLAWLIWTWQFYLPSRRLDAPAATSWRNLLATGKKNDPALNTLPPATPVLTPPDGTPYFGMLTWLFKEIARWKKAEGYTEVIGQDLGIIGAEVQEHTKPPKLTVVEVAQNRVTLGFNLFRHAGIWIESRRQGETGFTFLGNDTAAPYTDTRPVKVPGQAEWRDFRACWWDEGTPSMDFGPAQRVLVDG